MKIKGHETVDVEPIFMDSDTYYTLKALEEVIPDFAGYLLAGYKPDPDFKDPLLIEVCDERDPDFIVLKRVQEKVPPVENYDDLTEEEQEECQEAYLEQLGARTEFFRKRRRLEIDQLAEMMNMTLDEYLHWICQDGTLMTMDDLTDVSFALYVDPKYLTGYLNESLEPLPDDEDIYLEAANKARERQEEKSRQSGKKGE